VGGILDICLSLTFVLVWRRSKYGSEHIDEMPSLMTVKEHQWKNVVQDIGEEQGSVE
jgi:hypothetical protein